MKELTCKKYGKSIDMEWDTGSIMVELHPPLAAGKITALPGRGPLLRRTGKQSFEQGE